MEPSGDLPLWQRLAVESGAGRLRLEPDAARICADACLTYIDDLKELLERTRFLTEVGGYGTLPSAQALGAKFAAKGSGSADSIEARLREHIAVVWQMRDTFVLAGQQINEQDEATRERLNAFVQTL